MEWNSVALYIYRLNVTQYTIMIFSSCYNGYVHTQPQATMGIVPLCPMATVAQVLWP